MASRPLAEMWLLAKPMTMKRIVRIRKPPSWMGLRPMVSTVATVNLERREREKRDESAVVENGDEFSYGSGNEPVTGDGSSQNNDEVAHGRVVQHLIRGRGAVRRVADDVQDSSVIERQTVVGDGEETP